METGHSDPPATRGARRGKSAHGGEAQSPLSPSGQRTRQPWFVLMPWLEQNTFAPGWLPRPLRHPLVGYLVAALLELVAAAAILLLLSVFPSFAFLDAFTVVVVVLVALGWGAGPGLFATLVGTLLLYYAGLPPHFSWDLSDPADSMGLLFYFVAGVCVSVLASGSERRRRQAEELARGLAQAEAKSAQDYRRLRAVLEAMPSAVLIAGPQGQLEDINEATRTLWGGDIPLANSITDYAGSKAWWVKTGQPVAPEEWALARALTSGVAQLNDEMEIESLDGQHRIILNSAVPIRGEDGTIVGAVVNAQDISELRRLEQRTRDTLNALVAIGEALVQVPAVTTDFAPEEVASPIADMSLPLVARRVAELTRGVLGSRRVSIGAIDAATGLLRPITVVGLPPAQEQAWWASFSPLQCLDERLNPAMAAALRAGEPVYLETASFPDSSWNVLSQARTGLVMPMRMGEELIGAMLVDYGEHGHDYTAPDEVLLTTIARLGALVLERDRLLRQWTEARANELALRATTARMDAFLGIASHELKAPLAAIQVNLQGTEYRLRKDVQRQAAAGGGGERAVELFQEHLIRTQQQVERLDRLVNDLVDASRMQSGKLEFRQEACDLATIVQRAVDTQRQVAFDRTIGLQLPAEGDMPVLADPGRIEQVVTNYLTNALKYSPSDRPVEVGVQTDGRMARVWVRDRGPGIPEEEHQHIWERFHRAKGIEVQSGSGIGLGLGLHICRTIVEHHQGQVGVDSAPGAGSTFWFTLPLAGDSTPEPDVSAP
jgi:signal transduction histidine kinase/PAS domain-containing protein